MRVGIVVFSDRARIAIPLDMYTDKPSLLVGVDNLVFLGGSTNLAEGFNLLNSEVISFVSIPISSGCYRLYHIYMMCYKIARFFIRL